MHASPPKLQLPGRVYLLKDCMGAGQDDHQEYHSGKCPARRGYDWWRRWEGISTFQTDTAQVGTGGDLRGVPKFLIAALVHHQLALSFISKTVMARGEKKVGSHPF
jgi:hypothetical protein